MILSLQKEVNADSSLKCNVVANVYQAVSWGIESLTFFWVYCLTGSVLL